MRATKKLILAAEILEQERISDFEPGHLVGLVRRGKITPAQIYTACMHFGYRWKNDCWRMFYPAWLENEIRRENVKTIKNWTK